MPKFRITLLAQETADKVTDSLMNILQHLAAKRRVKCCTNIPQVTRNMT